jgi:hypothetical protein
VLPPKKSWRSRGEGMNSSRITRLKPDNCVAPAAAPAIGQRPNAWILPIPVHCGLVHRTIACPFATGFGASYIKRFATPLKLTAHRA